MKKLIYLFLIVTLISCDEPIIKEKKYKVEVLYDNGERDTVIIRGNKLQLSIGYGNDHPMRNRYTNEVIATGVKDFRILQIDEETNKN